MDLPSAAPSSLEPLVEPLAAPLGRTRGIKSSFSQSHGQGGGGGGGGDGTNSSNKKRSRTDDEGEVKPKVEKAKTGGAPDEELADDNDWQCSICNQLKPDFQSRSHSEETPLDVLVSCEGGCLRSFHALCLGFDLETVRALELPDAPPFLCKDCRNDHQSHCCGLCGKSGSVEYMPLRLLGSSLEESCGAPELLQLVQSQIPVPLATATAAVAAAAGVQVGGGLTSKSKMTSQSQGGVGSSSKVSPSVAPALTPLELVKKALKNAHAVPFDEDLDEEDEENEKKEKEEQVMVEEAKVKKTSLISLSGQTNDSTSPAASLNQEQHRMMITTSSSSSAESNLTSPRQNSNLSHSQMSPGNQLSAVTVPSDPAHNDSMLSSTASADHAAKIDASSTPLSETLLLAPVAAAAALSVSFALPASNPKPPQQAACVEPAPSAYIPPIIAGAPSYLVGAYFSGLRKCSLQRCGRFYHYSCLRQLSDSAVGDFYYRAAKGQKHEPPITVLATFPELDLLQNAVLTSSSSMSSPKAATAPTSSQTNDLPSSSSSSLPLSTDDLSVVSPSLSSSSTSPRVFVPNTQLPLDPAVEKRKAFEVTFFPPSLRPNPQLSSLSSSASSFVMDPHANPHVLTEPLWHALESLVTSYVLVIFAIHVS
jgi:hypothetical protein